MKKQNNKKQNNFDLKDVKDIAILSNTFAVLVELKLLKFQLDDIDRRLKAL